MKKVSLLLATAAFAWLTGCSQDLGETFFFPNDASMADIYYLTEATVNGVSLAPSEISGSIVLTWERTYSIDITIPGMHHTRSGTYHVPSIEESGGWPSVVELDGGNKSLFIKDNGRKLGYSLVQDGHFMGFEFTRS